MNLKRHRIMRRRPGIWLCAYDRPGKPRKIAPSTTYYVWIRKGDGSWYANYNTGDFAWALRCWKEEVAWKFLPLRKQASPRS